MLQSAGGLYRDHREASGAAAGLEWHDRNDNGRAGLGGHERLGTQEKKYICWLAVHSSRSSYAVTSNNVKWVRTRCAGKCESACREMSHPRVVPRSPRVGVGAVRVLLLQ